MKAYCLKMFIEYMNDFLTESAFADYYAMDDVRMNRILSIGRRLAYR